MQDSAHQKLKKYIKKYGWICFWSGVVECSAEFNQRMYLIPESQLIKALESK